MDFLIGRVVVPAEAKIESEIRRDLPIVLKVGAHIITLVTHLRGVGKRIVRKAAQAVDAVGNSCIRRHQQHISDAGVTP